MLLFNLLVVSKNIPFRKVLNLMKNSSFLAQSCVGGRGGGLVKNLSTNTLNTFFLAMRVCLFLTHNALDILLV